MERGGGREGWREEEGERDGERKRERGMERGGGQGQKFESGDTESTGISSTLSSVYPNSYVHHTLRSEGNALPCRQ